MQAANQKVGIAWTLEKTRDCSKELGHKNQTQVARLNILYSLFLKCEY